MYVNGNFSSGNNQGLVQDARFLVGLQINDTGSYPTSDITRNINSWYRKANTWIWNASGKWEYDDSNYTDLPIATTDLVADQQDYSLPSTGQKILRVEILDQNGNYNEITQIDQTEITSGMTEFYETAGMPAFYDLVGNSIFLYPKPSATETTLTAGLKAYFSRDIQEFGITATSTEPGFNSDFHRLLSYGAALDFALANGMPDKINILRENIQIMKEDLTNYYSSRNPQKRVTMRPSNEGIVGYY